MPSKEDPGLKLGTQKNLVVLNILSSTIACLPMKHLRVILKPFAVNQFLGKTAFWSKSSFLNRFLASLIARNWSKKRFPTNTKDVISCLFFACAHKPFFFSRIFLFLAFLFNFIASFVAHFIVFFLHEILVGFLSNKGKNLICKE